MQTETWEIILKLHHFIPSLDLIPGIVQHVDILVKTLGTSNSGLMASVMFSLFM